MANIQAFAAYFRDSNIEHVAEMTRPYVTELKLWALDETNPKLSDETVGVGRFPKFSIVNRLYEQSKDFDYLLLLDDDISMTPETVTQLLYWAEQLNSAIAQPALLPGSNASHPITLQNPHTLARCTNFVEIGPMVLIRRDFLLKLMPFDEEFSFGWGYDVLWSRMAGSLNFPMAIVDSAAIAHKMRTVASTYDHREAYFSMLRLFLKYQIMPWIQLDHFLVPRSLH